MTDFTTPEAGILTQGNLANSGPLDVLNASQTPFGSMPEVPSDSEASKSKDMLVKIRALLPDEVDIPEYFKELDSSKLSEIVGKLAETKSTFDAKTNNAEADHKQKLEKLTILREYAESSSGGIKGINPLISGSINAGVTKYASDYVDSYKAYKKGQGLEADTISISTAFQKISSKLDMAAIAGYMMRTAASIDVAAADPIGALEAKRKDAMKKAAEEISKSLQITPPLISPDIQAEVEDSKVYLQQILDHLNKLVAYIDHNLTGDQKREIEASRPRDEFGEPDESIEAIKDSLETLYSSLENGQLSGDQILMQFKRLSEEVRRIINIDFSDLINFLPDPKSGKSLEIVRIQELIEFLEFPNKNLIERISKLEQLNRETQDKPADSLDDRDAKLIGHIFETTFGTFFNGLVNRTILAKTETALNALGNAPTFDKERKAEIEKILQLYKPVEVVPVVNPEVKKVKDFFANLDLPLSPDIPADVAESLIKLIGDSNPDISALAAALRIYASRIPSAPQPDADALRKQEVPAVMEPPKFDASATVMAKMDAADITLNETIQMTNALLSIIENQPINYSKLFDEIEKTKKMQLQTRPGASTPEKRKELMQASFKLTDVLTQADKILSDYLNSLKQKFRSITADSETSTIKTGIFSVVLKVDGSISVINERNTPITYINPNSLQTNIPSSQKYLQSAKKPKEGEYIGFKTEQSDYLMLGSVPNKLFIITPEVAEILFSSPYIVSDRFKQKVIATLELK